VSTFPTSLCEFEIANLSPLFCLSAKLVASLWREESAEVKEVYARRASVEAKLHAERYPGE